jgi:dTDP-6-deoxy-L-talose 4-dehydrogenase (NAD+)
MSQGRVLVTGATGFIGRHVMECLAQAGRPVRAVIRSGSAPRLQHTRDVEIIESPDIFNESPLWWKRACSDVDKCLHLAWIAKPGEYLHSIKNFDCLSGTISFARGAAEAGVSRFVGVGTCLEYRIDDRPLSTETPLCPRTLYGGAKAATFQALSAWFFYCGTSFLWPRLFHVYGEGEDQRRFIPYLHKMMADGHVAELTSCHQVRDFLDVKDCAQRLTSLIDSDVAGAFNLCSGVPVTLRQVAESIAAKYGRSIDLLKFGAKPELKNDPPFIVGVPSFGG